MANTDIEIHLGNADVNFKATTPATNPSSAVKANFNSVAELRTYLAAQQPATYTSATLDVMSKNDMIFAARKFSNIEYS